MAALRRKQQPPPTTIWRNFFNSERTVGAALRGRPAWNSVSEHTGLDSISALRRAATEGRPYSTFRVLISYLRPAAAMVLVGSAPSQRTSAVGP